MCDFKPGDEVVRIDTGGIERAPFQIGQKPTGLLVVGQTYVIESVCVNPKFAPIIGVHVAGVTCPTINGWDSRAFRKVERKNDSLSIEAFLTIKPGFEEPKRTPAKKRERV